MKKYQCIIVEDEPLAAEVLEDYIRQVHFLELKRTCTNAIYAMEALQNDPIDLIFLDIHLPKIKGIDFLKTLKHPPQVIITSAYKEYALEGYEFSVIDYLVKPIEFNRFLMAVNKIRQQVAAGPEPIAAPRVQAAERPYLYFNVRKKQVKLYLDEILYVESLREYVKIITGSRTIITKLQLGDVEDMLPKNDFFRIHRSFIISKNKIEAFSATDVEISGKEIPIGRNYKEFVLSNLKTS